MILVAIGSNVSGPWGPPRATVLRAIQCLDRWPLQLRVTSTLLLTKPMGPKNQPNYVNAVVELATHLPPHALLQKLHEIERQAGRTRRVKWGPRTLDLDIIDYHGQKMRSGDGLAALHLPHPGIAERSFVLGPLHEIAPFWKHPVTRTSAALMLRKLNR